MCDDGGGFDTTCSLVATMLRIVMSSLKSLCFHLSKKKKNWPSGNVAVGCNHISHDHGHLKLRTWFQLALATTFLCYPCNPSDTLFPSHCVPHPRFTDLHRSISCGNKSLIDDHSYKTSISSTWFRSWGPPWSNSSNAHWDRMKWSNTGIHAVKW